MKKLSSEIVLFLLFSKTISSIMFQICFWVNHSQGDQNIKNYSKYISGHVLQCTQNCHLNSNSTHCAMSQWPWSVPVRLCFFGLAWEKIVIYAPGRNYQTRIPTRVFFTKLGLIYALLKVTWLNIRVSWVVNFLFEGFKFQTNQGNFCGLWMDRHRQKPFVRFWNSK